jgi:hypothetical protein
VTPRPRRELWLRARAASILLGAGCVACADATSACSGGSGEGSPEASTGGDAPDAAGDEPVAHTYAPTFTALWGEVFTPTCAILFCHGGSDDFLSMATKDTAYAAMVGVVSHGPQCGSTGLTIVEPGKPEASLLYLKVTSPPCGNKMPAMYGLSLDSREIDQIKQWITLGAQND